jgi:hypothetical protein
MCARPSALLVARAMSTMAGRGYLGRLQPPVNLELAGGVLPSTIGPAGESSTERVRHAALLAGAQAVSGDLTLRFPAGRAPAVSAGCDGIATSFPGSGRLRLLVEPAALADAGDCSARRLRSRGRPPAGRGASA